MLVTQFFTYSRKPTRFDCEQIARKLILKYPFMKDDMGNGYVSAINAFLDSIIIGGFFSANLGR